MQTSFTYLSLFTQLPLIVQSIVFPSSLKERYNSSSCRLTDILGILATVASREQTLRIIDGAQRTEFWLYHTLCYYAVSYCRLHSLSWYTWVTDEVDTANLSVQFRLTVTQLINAVHSRFDFVPGAHLTRNRLLLPCPVKFS